MKLVELTPEREFISESHRKFIEEVMDDGVPFIMFSKRDGGWTVSSHFPKFGNSNIYELIGMLEYRIKWLLEKYHTNE